MNGYTVKWSVDTIEELLDNGHLSKNNSGDVVQALNDLNTHFKYGNISENRYDYLKCKLDDILNNG